MGVGGWAVELRCWAVRVREGQRGRRNSGSSGRPHKNCRQHPARDQSARDKRVMF